MITDMGEADNDMGEVFLWYIEWVKLFDGFEWLY